MTEKELIILASHGNETAFQQLYEIYDERLARFVYSRVNNPKEAEDLIADIWEKIIVHMKQFDGQYEKSFQSWIFTIARNTVFNYYKNIHHREPALSIERDEILVVAKETTPIDQMAQEKIHTLMKTLPDHQYKILQMKYFQDLKNKEIAQILNISEKTVAAHLSWAIKKISKRCSNLGF